MTSETMPVVAVEIFDRWAEITLARPHRKNAMTGPMMDELANVVRQVDADDTIDAVVLRGADGAFCSGVDLKEMAADPPWKTTFSASVYEAHVALYECACPIICAVERFAINGGAAFAFAGDIIVIGEEAFIQVGEIQQGMQIPMNAAWMALKMSESQMARFALVGDRVAGSELLRLGVVHQAVASDQVLAAARAHAARLASHPPGAARLIKASIRHRTGVDAREYFRNPTPSSFENVAMLDDR